jgi:lipoprotein-releasing system ATP-binding protein
MRKTGEPVVKARGLKKVFETGSSSLTVLNGLDLTVNRGEIVSVIGKSGCGKSTLLNVIGGLDAPTEGTVVIRGSSLQRLDEEELSRFRNRYIGFIFQFHHLLAEFTACENIMMPYLIHDYDNGQAYTRAVRLMRLLDIEDKKSMKPGKLSGGECQRVAIARALVNDPEIVLADEPTGNLDEYTAEKTKNLLFDIVKKLDNTLIIVSHNRAIVNESTRVYQLNYGILNDLLDRGI